MPLVVPPRQEFARIVLIIVVIFFLYIAPDSPTSGARSSQDSLLDHTETKNLLGILNSSQWQDFAPRSSKKEAGELQKYINLTGFRENDGYQGWQRLNVWKERCVLFHQEANRRSESKEIQRKNYYTNITGVVWGKWTRYEADLTGLEKKEWPKINLSQVAPNSIYGAETNKTWAKNITGSSGSMMIRINEKDGEDSVIKSIKAEEPSIEPARRITATINLQDETNKGNGWFIRLHGVHWPKKGVLLLTTNSDKFDGIFGLPHLTYSFEQFISSQKLISQFFVMSLQKLEKTSKKDYESSISSVSENEAAQLGPQCEFVVFAQVYPIEINYISKFHFKDSELAIQEIERELRFPKGMPTPKIPKLQISTVILSPDCGFMLESKGPPDFTSEEDEHLIGEKQEVLLKNIHLLLQLFAVLILGQTFLLKAQSKDASTPSTVGRISLYTISIMLFADTFIFASLSLLSGTSPNYFPSALLASFISLMSVMLGIRFVSAIWNSQEPERRERSMQRQATESMTHPLTSEVQTDSHINVTDTNSVITPGVTDSIHDDNPIIIPSDQDIDAEILENNLNSNSSLLPTISPNASSTQTRPQSNNVSFATMYVRSVLLLTLILFVTLTSTSWPVKLRAIYIYTLSLAYLSFPAFQIYRNIQRNYRKALLWRFIIGQSVLRLTPFAYFYLKKDNILFSETDKKAFILLAGWLCIQCVVLAAQNIFGPRWGLPKTWYVEGWNYHPILRMESLEAKGLPIGLVSNQDPSSLINSVNTFLSPASIEQGKQGKKNIRLRCVDCAICMQTLEVPIIEVDKDTTTSSVAGILESKRYMVTPCRHIFHSMCLEGWMRFRLQCPICRENLPPT
ncbi:Transmembrane E3 ubiquitin-protein ligase 1 [Erysiphe necator]|nr:Transmembrane E3 ubiquitin-protein ligase 1 [Erysiphe necator]